jgi:hypothetical protein
MTKELPGAPWAEAYIVRLLLKDGFDLVIANGYEYTRETKTRTQRALDVLNGVRE